jgi:hypothetical protein
MFIYSNYEEESPTSGSVCIHALLHLSFTHVLYRRWQEWDWNLTFSEFNQTILRIADLKLANSQVQNSCRVVFGHHLTKAQEKALQMRLDLFMKTQPFKDYLATKVLLQFFFNT